MTSLSHSILWEQMHTYYDEMGLEIWEDELVPSQITSNTYLANIYAHSIVAQINDYRASVTASAFSSKKEPFYIIEMGAGHGKFSFYMLKALAELLKIYNLNINSICYVMTDISEKNIQYWRKHPALQEFIQNKTLDFALYNALTNTTIDLQLSQTSIKAKQLTKPLFVICNYIFDTLPQDAFQVQDGKLYETELVIQTKPQTQEQVEHLFENNEYIFKQNCVSENYYPHSNSDYFSLLNKILTQYVHSFNEASFLLPIGGIQAIEQFTQFSQSATMVLVADKGISAPSLLEGLDSPDISYHASVSMMVNFDALARYTELRRGISLLMPDQSSDFQVAHFIYNAHYSIVNSQAAFKMSLSSFSPQDLFNLFYKDDEPNKAFNSLDELIAIMNLADWDPSLFYSYYPQLLSNLEETEKNELTIAHILAIKRGLDKVWSRFFKLEKEQDIPYAMAAILYSIESFEKAIEFYQHSLVEFGENEEVFYNIAIAYQALEDIPNAIKYTQKSLDFDKNYKNAQNLMKELRELTLHESLCD